MSRADRELVILEFRVLPESRPAPVRVRHLLKRALRSYALECIRIIGLPDSWDDDRTHQIAQVATDDAEADHSSTER